MRGCTNRWRATKRGWSAICKQRSAFKARCCDRCRAEDFGLDMAARYLSAREFGGDLYDFLRYGPQQLGIALGDVSGKGTAAALYGAVAIGIMRSLAPQKFQPAEMLRQMNQIVGERRIEGRFMTICFATWQKGPKQIAGGQCGAIAAAAL